MTSPALPVRSSSTPDGPSLFGKFAHAVAGVRAARNVRAMYDRGDNPRSGAPVWRNSYTVGQVEDRVWKPINGGSLRSAKRWLAAVLKGAKKLELRTRAERRESDPGCRNGDLGEVGIEVLAYLFETVDYATGRLEPAIRTIADAIGRSYSAVHRALVRLRDAGFISWMRRSKPKDDPAPGDPAVEQASNAYALLCPAGMKGWLANLFAKRPAPECEADRRKREKADFEAMLDSLTAQERIATTWTGNALLGDTLQALARQVDLRHSHDRESSSTDETGGE